MPRGSARIAPLLVLKAYACLAFVDFMILAKGFGAVHSFVRGFTPAKLQPVPTLAITRAFELARTFYVKEVKCLHFGAAATLLLRRRVSTSLRPVVMEFSEYFHLC